MKPKNTLQKWEVAIVKAMIASKRFTNQEMLSYFSRPGRSLNQARIVDIKQERIHKVVKAASDAELEGFLSSWPDLDPKTGLHIRSDELIIKSREAMLLESRRIIARHATSVLKCSSRRPSSHGLI